LDWERNSLLFKEAYRAVRDVEQLTGKQIEIVLHLAGPANAEWLVDGFINHGVTDFDIIGLSYYWAWHKPTSIEESGQVIRTFKSLYPDKEVLIVETGYIWTNEWNDNASNIITETHPDYSPASPENQKKWLIDLTKEVLASDGMGVIYWEPAWVSSECWTQWGQGSHQEHATFFDFNNKLLLPGGIEWMDYNYNTTSTAKELQLGGFIQILTNSFSGDIVIKQHNDSKRISYQVVDPANKLILSGQSTETVTSLQLQNVPFGLYFVIVQADGQKFSKSIFYGKG
jgi:arabinogalactan endo-1,4-beta-galactosidase